MHFNCIISLRTTVWHVLIVTVCRHKIKTTYTVALYTHRRLTWPRAQIQRLYCNYVCCFRIPVPVYITSLRYFSCFFVLYHSTVYICWTKVRMLSDWIWLCNASDSELSQIHATGWMPSCFVDGNCGWPCIYLTNVDDFWYYPNLCSVLLIRIYAYHAYFWSQSTNWQ